MDRQRSSHGSILLEQATVFAYSLRRSRHRKSATLTKDSSQRRWLLAVVRVMMMMLTECVIERSFSGDRLRVAVVNCP